MGDATLPCRLVRGLWEQGSPCQRPEVAGACTTGLSWATPPSRAEVEDMDYEAREGDECSTRDKSDTGTPDISPTASPLSRHHRGWMNVHVPVVKRAQYEETICGAYAPVVNAGNDQVIANDLGFARRGITAYISRDKTLFPL